MLLCPSMCGTNLGHNGVQPAAPLGLGWRTDQAVDLANHRGVVLRMPPTHRLGAAQVVQPTSGDGAHSRQHSVASSRAIHVGHQQRSLDQARQLERCGQPARRDLGRDHGGRIGRSHRADEDGQLGQGLPVVGLEKRRRPRRQRGQRAMPMRR